jgi:hypothetical protein
VANVPHDVDNTAVTGATAMQIDTSKGHPDMDYKEHVGTYKGFLRMAQVAVVLVTLILVGMFVFLV